MAAGPGRSCARLSRLYGGGVFSCVPPGQRGLPGGIAAGLAALLACAPTASRPTPAPAATLAAAESAFALARDTRDRYEVAVASGSAAGDAAQRANDQRNRLVEALGQVDSGSVTGEDARALGVMRLGLTRDLTPITAGATSEPPADAAPPRCPPDATGDLDSLRARIYACYGRAQSRLPV